MWRLAELSSREEIEKIEAVDSNDGNCRDGNQGDFDDAYHTGEKPKSREEPSLKSAVCPHAQSCDRQTDDQDDTCNHNVIHAHPLSH